MISWINCKPRIYNRKSMQPARIVELLAPFLADAGEPMTAPQLTADDLHRISTYIDLLLRWNSRINLTAVRDPEEIVTRHFGESLFAARHLFPTRRVERSDQDEASVIHAASTSDESSSYCGRAALQGRVGGDQEPGALAPVVAVADIGSGAGFPGLPIKLWAPEVHLTLIESNHKKAAFLREITRALTLTNVDIQNARAESLPNRNFDIVTLRAVERFESILPTAARLVAPSNRLALLIGSSQLTQARQVIEQLAHVDPTWLHASWSGPFPIPNALHRILSIVRRPAST